MSVDVVLSQRQHITEAEGAGGSGGMLELTCVAYSSNEGGQQRKECVELFILVATLRYAHVKYCVPYCSGDWPTCTSDHGISTSRRDCRLGSYPKE